MTGSGIGELDISSDGSHILIGQLVSEEGNAKYWHLYMNVGDFSKTTELTPGAKGGVLFDGMTSDGTKVFFSSEEHLTNQDSAHSGPDIYMWEEGKPLTLISKGETETPGQPGDNANCDPFANTKYEHWNSRSGEVNCGDLAVGGGGGVAAGDGTIYFLSPEMLDGSENGVQNAPNLYLARPGEAPHFVATLESSSNAPLPPSEHPYRHSFGSFPQSGVDGVALDYSDGDAYVMSESNFEGTIEKFDSSGDLIPTFGNQGRLDGGTCPDHAALTAYSQLPTSIAVDQSNGDLYVSDLFNEVVDRFSPSGECLAQFDARGPTGVAIDPSNGDIYVTSYYGGSSGEGGVTVYDKDGKELFEFSTIPVPSGIAIDSHGIVYVVNDNIFRGRIGGEAVAYDSSGNLIGPLEAEDADGVTVDTADPSSSSYDHVYVDEGSEVAEFEPSTTNRIGSKAGRPIGSGFLPSTQVSGSYGLAVDAGQLDVTAEESGSILEFGPRIVPSDLATDNPLVVDSAGHPEARRTADFQITPNGNDAVFPSALPLTGFDSASHREVFRYDAPTETLTCASCNQTGEQATGEATLATDGLSLTDDGRVFFNATEGLVDRDLNEHEDVYEWEPQGSGPEKAVCKTAAGCLDLISPGTSPFNSSLLSASSGGTDVLFFTRNTLVHGDQNGARVRIYDAREEGGFPFIPAPVPCKASDECHGAGTPIPPPPNIQTFGSAPGGNESTPATQKCKVGFTRRHGNCVEKRKHRVHHNRNRHLTKHHRGGKK